jgi:uncharacterized protein YbjT (DUF2867 family)
MNILVLGAGGQLGRVLVSRLATDGHAVRAFVRRQPEKDVDVPAEVFIGDANSEASVRQAAKGQEAVVSAIGSGTLRRNTSESDTTKVTLRALEGFTGRYIAMSAGMVAPVSFIFDHVIRTLFLANLYREHRLVEELVKAGSIDWTIVRPPRLTNGPARGYLASVERRPGPKISMRRADVAQFLSDCLCNGTYRRQPVFLASR